MEMFGSYTQAVRILESMLVSATREQAIEIKKCISAILNVQEREVQEFERANEPICEGCNAVKATEYCKETGVSYCKNCWEQACAQGDYLAELAMEDNGQEH